MSRRLGYSWFDSVVGVSLDYLINGSGGWVMYPGFTPPWVGSKGLALVRLYVFFGKKERKKERKRKVITFLIF
jgi:hypothetical protein